jgi:hypothetical protein
MPFRNFSVDPLHSEAMRVAFRLVCDALNLNCAPEDPATKLVAMKIIDVAAAGELDPEKICAKVLEGLGTIITPATGAGEAPAIAGDRN